MTPTQSRARWLPASCFSVALSLCAAARAQEFDRVVIDADFPAAYQVEVGDVNGDGKLDVIAVGGSTCAWYENPSWKKRVVTSGNQTPGIISSATADVDGDGKAEIAIAFEFAMNQPRKGQLLLASREAALDDPWKTVPIAAIGSIHRLRWGDVDRDKRPDLVVASLFGPEAVRLTYADAAPLTVFRKLDWRGDARQPGERIASRPVMHAIDVIDLFKDGQSWILTADDLGTSLIGWGRVSDCASRERAGRRRARSRARIEMPRRPSAGPAKCTSGGLPTASACWRRSSPGTAIEWPFTWPRSSTSADGHQTLGPPRQPHRARRQAWPTDMHSGSPTSIATATTKSSPATAAKIIGCRCTISTAPANQWKKTVLDREVAAQDLRGGDLDGDGTPDVVAVGGSTHNVVWYRPRKR